MLAIPISNIMDEKLQQTTARAATSICATLTNTMAFRPVYRSQGRRQPSQPTQHQQPYTSYPLSSTVSVIRTCPNQVLTGHIKDERVRFDTLLPENLCLSDKGYWYPFLLMVNNLLFPTTPVKRKPTSILSTNGCRLFQRIVLSFLILSIKDLLLS